MFVYSFESFGQHKTNKNLKESKNFVTQRGNTRQEYRYWGSRFTNFLHLDNQ